MTKASGRLQALMSSGSDLEMASRCHLVRMRKFRHISCKLLLVGLLLCSLGCNSFSPQHSSRSRGTKSGISARPTQLQALSPPRSRRQPSSQKVATQKARKSAQAEKSLSSPFTEDPTMRRRRRGNASKKKSSYAAPLADRLLLDHDILTKEEEQKLGKAIKKAQILREELDVLIEERRAAKHQADEEADRLWTQDFDDDYDMSHLAVYGIQDFESDNDDENYAELNMIVEDASSLEMHERRSMLPAAWKQEADYIDNDLDLLKDQDIVDSLKLKGGRKELESILVEGAVARDTLIRSNIRLVLSIAKKWARQAAKGEQQKSFYSIYSGGWDRPSLDEAVQEGILGLTKAADKFEPKRGLRFTTYAHFWVTSYVRQCFQTAATGCLRLPAGFHDVRTKFRRLVKEYYDKDGEVPSLDILADEMGITLKRLQLILNRTRPLVSTDAPLGSGRMMRAGKAGVDAFADEVVLSDTLVDDEPQPEDCIELSFLRQSLENAMATELAPHERDVIRLRLGLDDGVSRSARQVAKECGGTLSISEVRLAEKRAYMKLRSPTALANYQFMAYLDFAGVDRATMKFR